MRKTPMQTWVKMAQAAQTPDRRDWLAFCRDLVQPWTEEFTAADLAATVEHQLAPELFDWKNDLYPYDERKRAITQWRLEHPGTTRSNMYRICEKLVTEGVLTRRQKIRGYHTWNYYKRAGSDRLLDA